MKLSEIKGKAAFDTAGELLGVVGRIAANKENAKASEKTLLEFFGAVAKNTPDEMRALIELSRGEPIPDEEYTALRVLREVNELSNNEELMHLFV